MKSIHRLTTVLCSPIDRLDTRDVGMFEGDDLPTYVFFSISSCRLVLLHIRKVTTASDGVFFCGVYVQL